MQAEKENLLKEAYQQFIQFGLGNLPIELYETIVAENYMGYGTALDEKLFSAIDLRDLVIRQIEQGQGMDMKFAETPVFRRISVSEDVAIIVAEILINIQVESSRHDLFLRMTTIMEYMNGKWIAVHSHGSRPEAAMGESDTWHINEWKRKNEELQKLVDEKTADLAGKNRELVIEACMERVRTVAMSMKEPADMLDVCRVISDQLTLLGVKEIRNVQTAIFYPEKGNYLNYEYYCLHDKKIITEVDYTLHKAQQDYANQMMGGPEAFHEEHFSGKELSDWVAYQSTTPQFVDSYLYTAESLNYYFYSMGPVALGVSTYAPLKPEDLILVRRFRNVFELAYTRFLDIQQAEEQAREAQIELALERVRARTMAMQHSEELKEAANLLFQQVQSLGIPAWSCGYNIWGKNEKEYTGWMSTQGSMQPSFKIQLTENPTFIRQYESRHRGEQFYAEEVNGQALVDHYNYMKSLPDFNPILEGFIHAGYSLPESQVNNVANFSHGNLIFITSKPVPESWDIFKRFAKVFEQTYTRFLDLQKAEEQAREAKIETALERVRSRSLAMHRSEELEQVVATLFDQLVELGLLFDGASIFLFEQKKRNIHHWVASKISTPLKVMMPYDENIMANQIIIDLWNANEKGEDIINKSYTGGVKDEYTHYVGKYNELIIPEWIRKMMLDAKSWTVSFAVEKYSLICIDSWSGQFMTDENFQVVKRFARVFEQAYTRFLDLQKAESQARDSQIELALERVRAKTMAMQKSDELREVVATIYEQLQHLGFTYGACSIVIMDKISGDMIWWISGFGKPYPESYYIPFFDHPFYLAQLNNWKEGKKYAVLEASGEMKKSYDEIIFSQTEFVRIPEETRKVMMAFEKIIFSNAYMKHGALSWSVEPIDDKHAKILERFAIVFEQTYTRFLDLQKAEKQARDAEIELALERVRARTMAMQKSDELNEIVYEVYRQIRSLNFQYGACTIIIMDQNSGDMEHWLAGFDQEKYPESYPVRNINHVLHDAQIAAWKEGRKFASFELSGEELESYADLMFTQSGYKNLPEDEKNRLRTRENTIFNLSYMNCGALMWAPGRLTDEQINIMQRFAKVFDQSYARFQDIQKAEEQARDAQIELALERVRAKTMAMQNSSELREIVGVIYDQLQHLGFTYGACAIVIMEKSTGDSIWWMAGFGKEKYPESYKVPFLDHPFYREQLSYLNSGKSFVPISVSGEEKKWYDELIFSLTEFNRIPEETQKIMCSLETIVFSNAYMKYGALSWGTMPISDEYAVILQRFAIVFEQTYTRFLDLQKAETQAREAQVESALEKVRSRTMAMQKSDELADAAYVLFQQLNHLGVIHERINIGIVKEETNTIDFWITEQGGNQINTRFSASLKEPTVISPMYAAWKAGHKSMIVDLTGEDLKSWLKYLTEIIGIPFDPAFAHNRRIQTAGSFSKGMLVLTTPEPLPEESIHLLEKFAGVFDLTYTRFNDLLLAEAQTHKANIEVALERVRARALAMQQPEELIEVAEVLRHEMGLLGVEELETSSIYLHDDKSDTVECWYAISDLRHPEKKLVADQINIDLQKTWVGRQMFDFYESDKTQVSILMQGSNRIEWIKYCASVSTVLGDFYGESIPDRTYHLYKFSNGAIGAASAGDISTESWELLSRTASVFSLAYSRFKDLTKARIDLQKLKEEKQRAELALTDLKAAQSQLVQAEKMASLGELTAGIAHEIQNPLNFVNNFSELSNELIEEMQEEMDKGNSDEVKNIVADIRSNLEKINLHGKRADAIVKGMLQHSRTTSGEKQPTDINALAEEYLRLAYHGLRAKDKNFNVILKTEYDASIGNINIIPQDIGRVLLNLINNAFYAVSEKQKREIEGFEPVVIISTKKLIDKVQIEVRDNGNGISQKVLDKIFQPFFTTKPTGLGTGLGLSLSYDIVKAHGGELKVETKEGEGSNFIIQLPIN